MRSQGGLFDAFGTIDCLVNSAGVPPPRRQGMATSGLAVFGICSVKTDIRRDP